MPQARAVRPTRKLRLLVVMPRDGHPLMDLARFAACPELELIGVATDCDDGLRLALMTSPDLVVLTWGVATPKLLHALEHLRDRHGSPRTVVVTDVSMPPLTGFTLPDRVTMIEVDTLNSEGLVDALRAVLATDSVS